MYITNSTSITVGSSELISKMIVLLCVENKYIIMYVYQLSMNSKIYLPYSCFNLSSNENSARSHNFDFLLMQAVLEHIVTPCGRFTKQLEQNWMMLVSDIVKIFFNLCRLLGRLLGVGRWACMWQIKIIIDLILNQMSFITKRYLVQNSYLHQSDQVFDSFVW